MATHLEFSEKPVQIYKASFPNRQEFPGIVGFHPWPTVSPPWLFGDGASWGTIIGHEGYRRERRPRRPEKLGNARPGAYLQGHRIRSGRCIGSHSVSGNERRACSWRRHWLVAVGTGLRCLLPSGMTTAAAAAPDDDEETAPAAAEREAAQREDAADDEADCQVGKAKAKVNSKPPFPMSRPAPEFPKDTRVAEFGRAGPAAGPARQVRAARLLDLLLHQLHAHPAGAEEARRGLSQRAGGHRRPLGQVRDREGHARTSPRRSCATRSSIRWSTTPSTRSGSALACNSWPTIVPDRPRRLRGLGHTAARSRSSRSTTCSRRRCPTTARQGCSTKRRSRFDLEADARPSHAAALSRQGAGRRGGRPAVHRRQQPQPHRRRRARRHAASRRSARARSAGADGDFADGQVQPAAGHGAARRDALRGRHREPPAPQGRSGDEAR